MKVIITAWNQRRKIEHCIDTSKLRKELTEAEKSLIALSKFYTKQRTYTKLYQVKIVNEKGQDKILWERG